MGWSGLGMSKIGSHKYPLCHKVLGDWGPSFFSIHWNFNKPLIVYLKADI